MDLSARIAAAAEPLAGFDSAAFGDAFDRFGQARVVLLGESSHGTSEFYRARCAITRRLIERHGFTLVAVEADWPDAASLDRQVRGRPPPPRQEPAFQRFPAWMWRNAEVAAFVHWLTRHNAARQPADQASFHGLDLYNLAGSMRAVIGFLERIDPDAAAVARERYGCLAPWADMPQAYGHAARDPAFQRCEDAAVAMLADLNGRRMTYAAEDGDHFLDAAANARLVKDAEAYYRAMYRGAADSWNVRDRHMFDTLCQLLEHRGPRARAVVWAHNSHIGDARQTDMGWRRGELNIGQLCRERFADAAVLIGMGTHGGTVAAADEWDAPMKIKPVNPSRPDSVEGLCHAAGQPRFLLDLRRADAVLRDALAEPRLERFIGVIYRPETELWSHYADAALSRQFDAWLWFDETRAVKALAGAAKAAAGPEALYPTGQ